MATAAATPAGLAATAGTVRVLGDAALDTERLTAEKNAEPDAIANTVQECQGPTLSEADIRKVITSYRQHLEAGADQIVRKNIAAQQSNLVPGAIIAATALGTVSAVQKLLNEKDEPEGPQAQPR